MDARHGQAAAVPDLLSRSLNWLARTVGSGGRRAPEDKTRSGDAGTKRARATLDDWIESPAGTLEPVFSAGLHHGVYDDNSEDPPVVHRCSAGAREKVEAVGGKIEVV